MEPTQPLNPQHPPQPEPQTGFPPQAPQTPSWQQTPPQQPYNQPSYQHPQPTQPPTPQPPTQNYQYGNPHQQPPTQPKNKKKLIVIIAAAVVAVGIGAFLLFGGGKSIVSKIAGVELEEYSNTTFGFSIKIPKDWPPEETNEEYIKQVTFTEPVGDIKDQSEANSHYGNVRVNYEFADQDYLEKNEQEYFDTFKKGLQRAISEQNEEDDSASTDYTQEKATVESEEMITVNGLKAYMVKLKVTNYDGEKDNVGYEYGMFVFVDSKTQYEVSVSAHESESINSKADEILASFKKL